MNGLKRAASVGRKFGASQAKKARTERAGAIEETRRRASALNAYLDLIPARFYLGTENPQVIEARKNADPRLTKTTSQVAEEAAAAAAAASAQEAPAQRPAEAGGKGTAAKLTKAAKRRLQRRGGAAAQAAETPKLGVSEANSRKELQERLERRISELKEERRLKQSERDKAMASAARAKKEAGTPNKPGDAPAAPKAKAGPTSEIGRVNFGQSSATLPFQAGVGRKGDKVKRLKAELRKSEAEARKIAKAEDRGEGDEVRRDLAMEKALKRARGEKVHDDAAKLRKAQKAMEVKKAKGKSKWEAMKDHQKQLADDKQAKRKENLRQPRGKKKKAKAAMLAERAEA